MGHASDPGFLVLHGLRLKGFAEAWVLAGLTGLDQRDVGRRLDAAAAAELVLHRDGRISGWALTPAGRAHHAELLAVDMDAAACREALRDMYPRFGELNADLKSVCTDWQLRDGVLN